MTPDRIPCCIIGCRRTAPKDRYPDAAEIICGKCYRLASKHNRRRLRKIQKLCRRLGGGNWRQQGGIGSTAHRLAVLEWQLWDRIKREAQEARVGIG